MTDLSPNPAMNGGGKGANRLPRLLVVEDDAGLQRQLKWAFDDFEVLCAGDGAVRGRSGKRDRPAAL